MNTYFISDIHLDANSAENSKLLLDFLQNTAQSADAIYILGDLFAIWFGDDIKAPYSDQIFDALQDLTSNKNIPIYFIRGNRDFLVGKRFSKRTGVIVLPDPYIINLYQRKALLTHGDKLCSADIAYQKFRAIVQHPIVKAFFLTLPQLLRKKLGEFVRKKTKISKKNYSVINNLYDVVPTTATAWFNKFKITTIIHGHTHHPAIHNDGLNTRIVLGDWTANSAKILVWNSQGYKLIDLKKT